MPRYEKFNQLFDDLQSLEKELAELQRECIMDGKVNEAEVNGIIDEMQFILHDSIQYQINKIRIMLLEIKYPDKFISEDEQEINE